MTKLIATNKYHPDHSFYFSNMKEYRQGLSQKYYYSEDEFVFDVNDDELDTYIGLLIDLNHKNVEEFLNIINSFNDIEKQAVVIHNDYIGIESISEITKSLKDMYIWYECDDVEGLIENVTRDRLYDCGLITEDLLVNDGWLCVEQNFYNPRYFYKPV